MKKHNFYAGPAILPESVKRKASESAMEYEGIGLSLMEISHRSTHFVDILDKTESNVRQLFGLNDDMAVLFLTGGASSQFYMSAMNLAAKEDTVAFLDTGTWSTKSIKEAKKLTNVEVVASSGDQNYNYIPSNYSIPGHARYFHMTSNNTIFGTQVRNWPECHCPIVCDMSSDIFSRNIPVEKFGLIYAGAQKNVGPAGMTLVIVRKDLIGKSGRDLPTMLNYQTHIDKKSSFNTPPVFPIYVTMLTLDWILEKGGVDAMEKRNTEKAKMLYDEIDRNPLFVPTVNPQDQSYMNATFLLKDDKLNQVFLDLCDEAGIMGIKGHRSVGGFRASIYNAMELDSIKVLTSVMKHMEQSHG
ncbi:MAG: 3-phosphoserine/phosphohydroxythreonine transaminase [Bacteroidia bacterium]|nr:3-phosphoserine/phosphohydroxythreonine transaminase [Bacteroidia bacterium]